MCAAMRKCSFFSFWKNKSNWHFSDICSERFNDVHDLNYLHEPSRNSDVILSAINKRGETRRRPRYRRPAIKKKIRERTTTNQPYFPESSASEKIPVESTDQFRECISTVSNVVPFDYETYRYCKQYLNPESIFASNEKKEHLTLNDYKLQHSQDRNKNNIYDEALHIIKG